VKLHLHDRKIHRCPSPLSNNYRHPVKPSSSQIFPFPSHSMWLDKHECSSNDGGPNWVHQRRLREKSRWGCKNRDDGTRNWCGGGRGYRSIRLSCCPHVALLGGCYVGSMREHDDRGRCNTLKFSNFRMLIGKIIKQWFSHNFKILPKIYLLYRKFRIRKIN
jgi:hypothetical protein